METTTADEQKGARPFPVPTATGAVTVDARRTELLVCRRVGNVLSLHLPLNSGPFNPNNLLIVPFRRYSDALLVVASQVPTAGTLVWVSGAAAGTGGGAERGGPPLQSAGGSGLDAFDDTFDDGGGGGSGGRGGGSGGVGGRTLLGRRDDGAAEALCRGVAAAAASKGWRGNLLLGVGLVGATPAGAKALLLALSPLLDQTLG